MISGFNSLCVPTYHLLTTQQIQSIHTATLELLETVGIDVHHDEARHMLADAGCLLKEKHRVRIPNWLVEAAIQSAPSWITIYDRLGNAAMRLEGRRVHYGLGTDLIRTYDLETGELRESLLKDVAAAARISDALQHIDFIGSYALLVDSPTNLKYLDSFKTEHWLPDQCNRDNLDTWLMKGRKDWAAMATEKAREILKTHTPAPLSDTAAAALADIRREAESKLKGHYFAS